MAMSKQARNKRRAQLVRRWAAYRIGRAQREIWRRKRRGFETEVVDEGGAEDLLAELPEGLLG